MDPPGAFGVSPRAAAWLLISAALVVTAPRWGVTLTGGGSMEPALHPGDLLFYRRRPARLRGGDIVVYSHPGWPRGVVHRVVRVLPDGRAVTRGDANPIPDRDPVPSRRLRGRVALVVPVGRCIEALARLPAWCYTALSNAIDRG
jgi:signal peptidase